MKQEILQAAARRLGALSGVSGTVALSIALGALAPMIAAADTTRSADAKSFGAYVDTESATQSETPVAVWDPDTGMADDTLLSLSVGDVLTTKTLEVLSAGVIGENAVTAQSNSTVQDVDILDGVVQAELVVAMANSATNGAKAVSDAEGSTILSLTVDGVSLGDVVPDPNTTIDVVGVGTVILNEQTRTGDSETTSGIDVNMIHLVLKDALTGEKTGDIIVGSASSDAAWGDPPP